MARVNDSALLRDKARGTGNAGQEGSHGAGERRGYELSLRARAGTLRSYRPTNAHRMVAYHGRCGQDGHSSRGREQSTLTRVKGFDAEYPRSVARWMERRHLRKHLIETLVCRRNAGYGRVREAA